MISAWSVLRGARPAFDHDLRRDFPHAAYDRVKFTVPVYQEGDVLHRMQVRIDEVQTGALDHRAAYWRRCPKARRGWTCRRCRPTKWRWVTWKGGAEKSSTGFARRESGRLARCKVKDPSLQNWPALSEAILGNIVPDFPVVNKSFNLSYSGTDRYSLMFEILRKSFATGVVTTDYPQTPAEVSSQARGRPEIDFPNWKDARPAVAACPTGALACEDGGGTRSVTLDLGKCTFCGLCAEADPAIRMTNTCELAASRKADLVTTAKYELGPGGTQQKLAANCQSPTRQSASISRCSRR